MKSVTVVPQNGIYTLPQASQFLGLSESTIRRHAKNGSLVSTKNKLGHFQFTQKNLESYIEEQGMANS